MSVGAPIKPGTGAWGPPAAAYSWSPRPVLWLPFDEPSVLSRDWPSSARPTHTTGPGGSLEYQANPHGIGLHSTQGSGTGNAPLLSWSSTHASGTFTKYTMAMTLRYDTAGASNHAKTLIYLSGAGYLSVTYNPIAAAKPLVIGHGASTRTVNLSVSGMDAVFESEMVSLVCTFDNPNFKIYMNGVLLGSWTNQVTNAVLNGVANIPGLAGGKTRERFGGDYGMVYMDTEEWSQAQVRRFALDPYGFYRGHFQLPSIEVPTTTEPPARDPFPTLLASVNRVRGLLRWDPVTELSPNDMLSSTIVDYLNTSAAHHLSSHGWSFMHRHDGQAYYPGRKSVTTGAAISQNTAQLIIEPATGNEWTAEDTRRFVDYPAGRAIVRAVFTGSPNQPGTSYVLDRMAAFASATVSTLETPYMGEDMTDGSLTIYCNEFVVPSDVLEVLSVRHQESPVRLENVNRTLGLDGPVPRALDYSGLPEVTSFGGLGTGTERTNSGTAKTGQIMLIWPVPDIDTVVDYSYEARFEDLTEADSEWVGIPTEHISMIEWMAFEMALFTNVEDQGSRAEMIFSRNQRARDALVLADRTSATRRVTRSLGISRGWQR